MQVRVARPCHCVIKNDLNVIYLCKDMEEAKKYAKETLSFLHQNHCKAHHFFITEHDKEIVIDSKFNVDDIVI